MVLHSHFDGNKHPQLLRRDELQILRNGRTLPKGLDALLNYSLINNLVGTVNSPELPLTKN